MRNVVSVRKGIVEAFIIASNVIEVSCNKPRQRKRGGEGREIFPELQSVTQVWVSINGSKHPIK